MHKENIPKGLQCEYEKTCSTCLLTSLILSQHDDFPEYHTEIYLQCTCGEFLEFILPVN